MLNLKKSTLKVVVVMNKSNVAWQVTETEEHSAVVVFQSHGLAARRLGANELGVDFEAVKASRVPQFDQFAERGSVPSIALLEDGWWLTCDECDHKIMAELRDDDENTPLNKVVVIGHRVYCNQHCQLSHDNEIQEFNERFVSFKQAVQQARPDLDFTDFIGGYPHITMIAKFSFPNSQFGGDVRDQKGDGDLTWFVASGDQEAWSSYEQSRKSLQGRGTSDVRV